VGDVSQSRIMRATLQKVDGEYQGACYPFRRGFASGCNRAVFAQDGSLWVGETARGWGSVGGTPWALQRLVWKGNVPFELEKMELTPSGFDLTFTQPVDAGAAAAPGAYSLKHYYYKYDKVYFAPIEGMGDDEVSGVKISADARIVSIQLPGLITNRIYQLNLTGLKSKSGEELLHSSAYYTLNRLVH
jgi:hypothetical protein